MDMLTVSRFIATMGCCALLIKWLKPLALKTGLVDHPGGRKKHRDPTPLIGGIAIFLSFALSLLTLPYVGTSTKAFITGSAILILIGILDDFHELSAHCRFAAQVVVSLLMIVWGKVSLTNFGDLLFLGPLHLVVTAIPVTVVAVVGVINAVNMTDGVDGLAAGLLLIQLGLLLLLSISHGLTLPVDLISLLMSAVLGYWLFNLPIQGKRAQVFMGDAGSMFLGFALAWFLVDLSQGEGSIIQPVDALWIMALPLYDIGRVMFLRKQQGVPLLQPDREHLHHYLLEIPLSAVQITFLMMGINLLLALFGLEMARLGLPEGWRFVLFVGLFITYWILTPLIKKIKKTT